MSALTVPDRALRSAVLALLLPLLIALPVSAHNGAVAIAVPLEGITVDGDLSDWPVGLVSYAVERIGWGDSPVDAEDFQAFFRVGYDATAGVLYVAVAVRDESTVTDSKGSDPFAGDGCTVFYGRHGDPVTELTLPGTTRLGEERAAAAVHTGRGATYEWSLPAGAGVLGFCVDVIDVDADGSRAVMTWDPLSYRGMGGDVLALARDTPFGQIEGHLRWEGSDALAMGCLVRIELESAAGDWIATRTDRQGACRISLPVGQYRVGPGFGRGRTEMLQVEVVAGETATARLVAARPTGRLTSGIEYKSVPAGHGITRGPWHTLGAADGLSPGGMARMVQDQNGLLWLGAESRLIRFDGHSFASLETGELFPSRTTVTDLLPATAGKLWIAVRGHGGAGGVCLLRGSDLVTYTEEDGLADSDALALARTKEGVLWIGTSAGVARWDGLGFDNFLHDTGFPWGSVSAVTVDGAGHVWFGTSQGVVRYDGESFAEFSARDGLMGGRVEALHVGPSGSLWLGGQQGLSRYDGTGFSTVTDSAVWVRDITSDGAGDLWLGTRQGLLRYDGHRFTKMDEGDGLAGKVIGAVLVDAEGALWAGSGDAWETGGGVSRSPGHRLRTFTTQDGLLSNHVVNLAEDLRGHLWITTWEGVARYDGTRFETLLPTPEGYSTALTVDSEGRTWSGMGRGVAVYDGGRWRQYGPADGLPGDYYHAGFLDRSGDLWFGGSDIAARFDGERFTTVPVGAQWGGESITQDGRGRMWFRTRSDGIWVYDGTELERLGEPDSLAGKYGQVIYADRNGQVHFGRRGGGIYKIRPDDLAAVPLEHELPGDMSSLLQDDRGHYWVATYGGGILRYDGLVVQPLSRRQGLPHDGVQKVIQSRDGGYWIASEGGLTHYRSGLAPPRVRLTDVLTDHRAGALSRVSLVESQKYLAFEYQGQSMSTPHRDLAYVYELVGWDEGRRVTKAKRVEYGDLQAGEYVFEVQAVDLDLNYSESVRVPVEVRPDYGRLAMRGGLALSLFALVMASTYGLGRRRALRRAEQALMREMEEELQSAHDMQMDLMPTEAPDVHGVGIAGHCVSANHVGGDFYQYFEREDALTVSLADVTGHAMEAAIPAVMFSGMLDNQMEQPKPLPELFQSLNHSLCRSLGEHTFVCLSMLEIDPTGRTMRVANCGCPYPLHYRAGTGEIAEVEVDAYPLGVRPETEYRATEIPLGEGDYLVLHSDGFSEATNAQTQLFGFDRTMEVIRQGCSEGLSPENLIERLIGEVKAFTGDEPQADDMTCVVIKVEA